MMRLMQGRSRRSSRARRLIPQSMRRISRRRILRMSSGDRRRRLLCYLDIRGLGIMGCNCTFFFFLFCVQLEEANMYMSTGAPSTRKSKENSSPPSSQQAQSPKPTPQTPRNRPSSDAHAQTKASTPPATSSRSK